MHGAFVIGPPGSVFYWVPLGSEGIGGGVHLSPRVLGGRDFWLVCGTAAGLERKSGSSTAPRLPWHYVPSGIAWQHSAPQCQHSAAWARRCPFEAPGRILFSLTDDTFTTASTDGYGTFSRADLNV